MFEITRSGLSVLFSGLNLAGVERTLYECGTGTTLMPPVRCVSHSATIVYWIDWLWRV